MRNAYVCTCDVRFYEIVYVYVGVCVCVWTCVYVCEIFIFIYLRLYYKLKQIYALIFNSNNKSGIKSKILIFVEHVLRLLNLI